MWQTKATGEFVAGETGLMIKRGVLWLFSGRMNPLCFLFGYVLIEMCVSN